MDIGDWPATRLGTEIAFDAEFAFMHCEVGPTLMRFPFWLVTPVRGENPPPAGECGTNWLPLAFSEAERMARYLGIRPAGQLEVRLVNRYSAAEIFAELRERGCEAICYDVQGDSEAHQRISLDDVIAQLEKSE